MVEIRKECLKIDQGGLELYGFVINSKDLREISFVSKREATNPQGYQRYLNIKRLKDVGEYINKPRATFPNSIIINLDPKKVRFEPDSAGKKGTLVISKEEGVAWIIDGQHRLYGFSFAEGKEFDVLVAAFIGLAIRDQATIFKVINSTQKGVSPSLIYDLIDLTKDAEYFDERGHEILKALNTDDDSPWKNLIKMLGVGSGIISQAAFIGELKNLLNRDAIIKEFAVGEQIKILKDYYTAIKEIFPEAWGNKKYVLCKTSGVAATVMVLPKVLIHCQIKSDFSKRTMIGIVNHLKAVVIPTEAGMEPLDFSGNQLGAFGGRKGQKALGNILEKALPSFRPSRS